MTPTKSQQAQEYAEKILNENSAFELDYFGLPQAWLDGYTAAEQSQWRSVEEELPEEKKVVLCFMPDMKDPYAVNDAYFDIAILLEGEFINLDAETIHPTHWMRIPTPSLPDTNTEKI